jgi:hypothetical protein
MKVFFGRDVRRGIAKLRKPAGFLLAALCIWAFSNCSGPSLKCYENPANWTQDDIGWEKYYLPACKDTLLLRTWVVEAPKYVRCKPTQLWFDHPEPEKYHVLNKIYSYATMKVRFLNIDILDSSALLFSKEYGPQEPFTAFGNWIYCDAQGCSASADNRREKGFCKSDTLIELSTDHKISLPKKESIALKQRIRASCEGFDTVIVFERRMGFERCGSVVTVRVE